METEKITREAAVRLVMLHSGVSRGTAEDYTDPELRQALVLLNLNVTF